MGSIDTNFKNVTEVLDRAVELITGDGHIGLTSYSFRDVTKLLKTLADTGATLLINLRRSGDISFSTTLAGTWDYRTQNLASLVDTPTEHG
jgi:hypothetical protein